MSNAQSNGRNHNVCILSTITRGGSLGNLFCRTGWPMGETRRATDVTHMRSGGRFSSAGLVAGAARRKASQASLERHCASVMRHLEFLHFEARSVARALIKHVRAFDEAPFVGYACSIMEVETNQPWCKFRDGITESARLLKHNDPQQALSLLDELLAQAIQENEASWVCTLCHHAAIISNFLGNQELVEHYYRQSLVFVPENPAALYGLAKVERERGELETARQYAARCYKAIIHGDDEIMKRAYLIWWSSIGQKSQIINKPTYRGPTFRRFTAKCRWTTHVCRVALTAFPAPGRTGAFSRNCHRKRQQLQCRAQGWHGRLRIVLSFTGHFTTSFLRAWQGASRQAGSHGQCLCDRGLSLMPCHLRIASRSPFTTRGVLHTGKSHGQNCTDRGYQLSSSARQGAGRQGDKSVDITIFDIDFGDPFIEM